MACQNRREDRNAGVKRLNDDDRFTSDTNVLGFRAVTPEFRKETSLLDGPGYTLGFAMHFLVTCPVSCI